MPQNIIQKIWNKHVVYHHIGHPQIFRIDTLLLHEVTSAQAFSYLRERNIIAYKRLKTLATVDHSIPTDNNRENIADPQAKMQVESLRASVAKERIPFYDINSGKQGIIHLVAAESGVVLPGTTIACGDSHTSTHGAFGSIAFGIGSSEVGHILATGCLLQQPPKTMKVEFLGKLPNYVSAKDAILKLIATIGISGAQGYLIEYTGACLKKFNMEDRMTICNMSIECGARAGIIAPDEVVFKYLYGLNYTPKNKEWRDAVAYWKNLKSDPDATYDSTVVIDVNEMEPMVTWGINPGMCIGISQKIPSLDQAQSDEKATYQKAYQYTGLQQDQPICGVPIDYVFFGSCTNARIPDFEIAARLLRDKTIHPDVRMIMVPASEYIKKEVEKRGWADIFIRAGVDWRNPGCSACLGMNDDKIPAGKRCISTSNRNFMGRQGPGSITHLGSPATVIASAIAGYITSPFYEKN